MKCNKQVKCEKCENLFVNKHYLIKHIEQCERIVYTCDHCKDGFEKKSEVRNHLNTGCRPNDDVSYSPGSPSDPQKNVKYVKKGRLLRVKQKFVIGKELEIFIKTIHINRQGHQDSHQDNCWWIYFRIKLFFAVVARLKKVRALHATLNHSIGQDVYHKCDKPLCGLIISLLMHVHYQVHDCELRRHKNRLFNLHINNCMDHHNCDIGCLDLVNAVRSIRKHSSRKG